MNAGDKTVDDVVGQPVKVPSESLASNAERIARFERETTTLDSLNHPYIARISACEKSGGGLTGWSRCWDFGLAKAPEPVSVMPGLSHSPTITTPAITSRAPSYVTGLELRVGGGFTAW